MYLPYYAFTASKLLIICQNNGTLLFCTAKFKNVGRGHKAALFLMMVHYKTKLY